MASYFTAITGEQAELIERAPVFFVATAHPDFAWSADGSGPINLSPKGGAPLQIIDPNTVRFVDHVGSGNETARHIQAGSPITIMICSFEQEDAAIVRLYGTASVSPAVDSAARQVIEIHIERTMTSCGYGLPVMSFERYRSLEDRGRRYKAKAK